MVELVPAEVCATAGIQSAGAATRTRHRRVRRGPISFRLLLRLEESLYQVVSRYLSDKSYRTCRTVMSRSRPADESSRKSQLTGISLCSACGKAGSVDLGAGEFDYFLVLRQF